MEKQALKTLLLEIQKTDFEIPEQIDINYFADDLLKHIGDLDPVLRDDLILSCLWTMIVNDDMTEEKDREILETLLSDDYLFLGLGEKDGDKVFTRTFTILIVGALVEKYEDIAYEDVYKRILDYGHGEVDFRGYVPVKGWAHSTAHLSDTLGRLAVHTQSQEEHLIGILELIEKKMKDNSIAYVYGEDERLAKAMERILTTNKLSKASILNHIQGFKAKEGPYEERYAYNGNCRNYLRSLYCRLRRLAYDQEVLESLEEAIIEEFKTPY